jgi:methyltransferase
VRDDVRTLVVVVIAYCAAMRLFELWLSRRNARVMLARGARLVQRDGMRALALVHGAWFAALALEELWLGPSPVPPGVRWLAGGAALLAELLRISCKVTLGARWNVRVLVLDGAPLVKRGPYRFLEHPNYLAATLVVVLTPLALGLPWTALLCLPAKLLAVRARLAVENDALAQATR